MNRRTGRTPAPEELSPGDFRSSLEEVSRATQLEKSISTILSSSPVGLLGVCARSCSFLDVIAAWARRVWRRMDGPKVQEQVVLSGLQQDTDLLRSLRHLQQTTLH
eukprot:5779006-Amphidinium_carterae.1